MKEKIVSAWNRFDTWYWISGARDLCGLSWKFAKFFGCFMISGVLMMGGLMKLQEIRNIDPNSPLSFVLAFIGFTIILRGSVSVAESGLLWKTD